MKRLLFAILLLFSGPAIAQRPALNSPVIRFDDANGKPLVGGLLYSYTAGTTTPLATYVDPLSGTLNQNPVVLDSTGSARVFLGAAVYKFVLTNSAGVVQWTADNVGQGAFAASSVSSWDGRVGAVVPATGDYNCAQITGAICSLPDPPTLYNQTIDYGGTPLTQRPSLNMINGTAGSIAVFTITSGGSGYTSTPTVTFVGGGCATAPTGTVTVTSGVVVSGTITGGGTGCTSAPVPAFTGGSPTVGAVATTTLAVAGVVCVDNPTHTSTDCIIAPGGGTSTGSYTMTDVTASRTFGGVYENTTSSVMFISGWGTTGGSATGQIDVYEGPSSASLNIYGNAATATVAGGKAGFFAAVLPGYFYSVVGSVDVSSLGKLVEFTTAGGGGGGGGGGITQLTGDGTAGPGSGSQALTLATVNSNVGSCGDATHVAQVTLDAKGRTTACTAVAITGGGSYTPPTGTGFPHITSGAQDLAARAVDLSSADATGTLAAAREPAHTADVTNTAGSLAMKVVAVNNTNLAGLGTGILKNTTGTGVPSIIAPSACSAGLVPNGIDASGNAAGCLSVPSVLGYTPAQAASLIASPIVRYDMIHVSGTTLTDSSGNGNNGTLVGSTLPVANATNLFFAQSSAVSVPSAANSAKTWYITTFVTPTLNQTIAQSAAFQSLINSSLGAGVGINVLSRGENLGYSLWNTTFSTACYALTTGYVTYALTLGTNSSTDPDRFYINGQECGTYQVQGASAGAQTSGNLFLGSSASGVFANSSNIGPWYWAEAFSAEHTPDQVRTESTNINNIVVARGIQTQPPVLNLGLPQLTGGLDSITAGAGSTSGTTGWMSYLSLTNQPSYNIVNFGIGGDTLLRALEDAPYRDAPQCTSTQGPNLWVVLAGINDLSGDSPTQVFAELNSYVGILKAAGCRVYIGTIIDNGNTGFGGAPLSTLKNTYDQLILTGWQTTGADGVIDFADIICLGADGSAGGACFNNLVHPNDTGYALMGAAASNKLNYDFGFSDLNPHILAATGAYTMKAGDGTLNIASASATTPLTMPSCIGQTGAVYHINNQQAVNTVTVVGSLSSQPINGSTSAVTIPSNTSLYLTDTRNSTAVGGCYWMASPTGTGGGGSATVIQVNGTPTTTATPVNLQTSTANSVGLTVTPSNPSAGNVKLEVTGGAYSGTAANLSGTPTLPNGTAAATQTTGDTSTKLATDAFVGNSLAPLAPVASPTFTGTATVNGTLSFPTTGTATSSANFGSRPCIFFASFWGGSSAGVDDWGCGVTLGAGTNPTSTFKIGHDNLGTPGFAAVEVPNLQVDSISSGTSPICANGTGGALTTSGCSSLPVCSDTSASGTAQSCTTSPSFTPVANSCVVYTTTTANTGTGLTLNVNSLGAKSVAKWLGTTTLAAGDVKAGSPQLACYNGTVWNLSTIGNAPSGGSGGYTAVRMQTISSGINIAASTTLCVGAMGAATGTPNNTFFATIPKSGNIVAVEYTAWTSAAASSASAGTWAVWDIAGAANLDSVSQVSNSFLPVVNYHSGLSIPVTAGQQIQGRFTTPAGATSTGWVISVVVYVQ